MVAHDDFELTRFGKGAICVGAVALLIDVGPVLGLYPATLSGDAALWRAFAWRLAFTLVCLRIWVVIASKLGAHIAASSTSLFVEFIMALGNQSSGTSRWRKTVAGMVIKRSAEPGGSWDMDTRLLNILMDEAEGFSSGVWILGATVVAAIWSGLPVVSNLTFLPHLVIALVSWRFIMLLIKSLGVVSQAVMENSEIPVDASSVRGVFRFLDVFVIVLGALFILSNVGFNVSAALTGLGVTSVLVGLSSQAVLKDLFSWLVLITQRPFVTGDFVSVCGAPNGWVETVNFLTTWVRAPAGDLLVMSNSKVTEQPIVNLSNVKTRRYDLGFEVSALCSVELLEEVPGIVKAAVEQQAKCNYCNCWLDEATSFGFKFMYQFFAECPDVQEARNASTEIWFQILRCFKEKEIVLASAERLQRGCVAGS
eukprot:TRINITY_DN72584_c0_g1_i1.p1 TRINITY_DN72584_c0_g1~~TRINITY_DN72584_c0_g1_i1.p1  ORF type:complete len:424 (-),score=61.67 TRINITY_DN72584_c0_g1_i1:219-1490(-)